MKRLITAVVAVAATGAVRLRRPFRMPRWGRVISFIIHGAVKFVAKMRDNAKFGQGVVVDLGGKLDGCAETRLTANIIAALAMKFAISVRCNREPLGDKKGTDTETTMALLYSC